jgi:type IV secretory pathway TraG/TraD family ATPase VirD4
MFAMTKSISTVATSPVTDLVVKSILDPSIMPLWGLLGLVLALSMLGNRHKYGALADGRMASERERQAGVRRAIDRIKHPTARRAALYIAVPIGCEVPNAENIDRFEGTLIPVIDINRGTVVVGNQGSGKSESVIDPLLKSAIAQGFGVLMLDIKYPEQSQEIIPYAITQEYEVSVLAPGFEESASCNIIDAIADENDSTTSDRAVYTIRANLSDKDADRDAFFDGGGEGMISGCMLLAKWIARLEGHPEVANLLLVDAIANSGQLSQRLTHNRASIPYAAYRSFSQFLSAHSNEEKNNTEASLQAVASSIMKPLISSKFIDVVAGKPDFPCFDPERPFWIGEKNLVVLGVSQELRQVVLPLIVTVLEQLGSYNLNSKRKRKQPLVIGLDEFRAIKLDVVMDDWLPEKRSAGASVIIGIQYLAQILEKYGEEGIDKLLGSANKFYGSTGSVRNAKIVADEFGEKEILIGSRSRSRNGGTHPSQSTSESDQTHKINVIAPLQLKQFPIGQFVIDGVATTNQKTGTAERVGIPYIRRIDRLDDVRTQQTAISKQLFDAFVESVIAAKAQQPKLDLSASAAYYHALVDKYLPAGTSHSPAVAPVRTVWLSHLLQIANSQRYQFAGDPTDRAVVVPTDWEQPLSLDRVIELIETAGLRILQTK